MQLVHEVSKNKLRSQISLQCTEDAATEVLANALDAKATAITVLLQPTSSQGFIVEDDGHGIGAQHLSQLAVRYHSSKSPQNASLGFRGEALASIAQTAQLTITTRAAGTFQTYQKCVAFGKETFCGPCVANDLAYAGGAHGTRVEVTRFEPMQANGRAQPKRPSPTTTWLQSCVQRLMVLALPHIDTSLVIKNAQGRTLLHLKQGRSLLQFAAQLLNMQIQQPHKQQPTTRPGSKPGDAIEPQGQAQENKYHVYNPRPGPQLQWLEEVEHIDAESLSKASGAQAHVQERLQYPKTSSASSAFKQDCTYRLLGAVMSPELARPGPDSQFMYVNRRPVHMPREVHERLVSGFRALAARCWAAAHGQQQYLLQDEPSRMHNIEKSELLPLPFASYHELRSCQPAFLLLLECPPSHIAYDGEADKSLVSITCLDAVGRLVARLAQRSWDLAIAARREAVKQPQRAHRVVYQHTHNQQMMRQERAMRPRQIVGNLRQPQSKSRSLASLHVSGVQIGMSGQEGAYGEVNTKRDMEVTDKLKQLKPTRSTAAQKASVNTYNYQPVSTLSISHVLNEPRTASKCHVETQNAYYDVLSTDMAQKNGIQSTQLPVRVPYDSHMHMDIHEDAFDTSQAHSDDDLKLQRRTEQTRVSVPRYGRPYTHTLPYDEHHHELDPLPNLPASLYMDTVDLQVSPYTDVQKMRLHQHLGKKPGDYEDAYNKPSYMHPSPTGQLVQHVMADDDLWLPLNNTSIRKGSLGWDEAPLKHGPSMYDTTWAAHVNDTAEVPVVDDIFDVDTPQQKTTDGTYGTQYDMINVKRVHHPHQCNQDQHGVRHSDLEMQACHAGHTVAYPYVVEDEPCWDVGLQQQEISPGFSSDIGLFGGSNARKRTQGYGCENINLGQRVDIEACPTSRRHEFTAGMDAHARLDSLCDDMICMPQQQPLTRNRSYDDMMLVPTQQCFKGTQQYHDVLLLPEELSNARVGRQAAQQRHSAPACHVYNPERDCKRNGDDERFATLQGKLSYHLPYSVHTDAVETCPTIDEEENLTYVEQPAPHRSVKHRHSAPAVTNSHKRQREASPPISLDNLLFTARSSFEYSPMAIDNPSVALPYVADNHWYGAESTRETAQPRTVLTNLHQNIGLVDSPSVSLKDTTMSAATLPVSHQAELNASGVSAHETKTAIRPRSAKRRVHFASPEKLTFPDAAGDDMRPNRGCLVAIVAVRGDQQNDNGKQLQRQHTQQGSNKQLIKEAALRTTGEHNKPAALTEGQEDTSCQKIGMDVDYESNHKQTRRVTASSMRLPQTETCADNNLIPPTPELSLQEQRANLPTTNNCNLHYLGQNKPVGSTIYKEADVLACTSNGIPGIQPFKQHHSNQLPLQEADEQPKALAMDTRTALTTADESKAADVTKLPGMGEDAMQDCADTESCNSEADMPDAACSPIVKYRPDSAPAGIDSVGEMKQLHQQDTRTMCVDSNNQTSIEAMRLNHKANPLGPFTVASITCDTSASSDHRDSRTSLVTQLLSTWGNPVAAQQRAVAGRKVLSIEQVTLEHKPALLAAWHTELQQSKHQSMARGEETNGTKVTTSSDVQFASAKPHWQALVPDRVDAQDLQNGWTVLGQVEQCFLIVRSAKGDLLAIDQHAAHERIRLEHLTAVLHAAVNRRSSRQHPGTLGYSAKCDFPMQECSTANRGVCAARRGNGGKSEPVPFVIQPIAISTSKNAAQDATVVNDDDDGGDDTSQRGILMSMSYRECVAYLRHQQAVFAWGWRLQPAQHSPRPITENTSKDDSNTNCTVAGEGAMNMISSDITNSYVLTHVPCVYGVMLSASDLQSYLHELADLAGQGQTEETGPGCMPQCVLRVLRSRACRTALMFGDPLLQSECQELFRALTTCKLMHLCAHGRPTTAPLVHVPLMKLAVESRSLGAHDVYETAKDPPPIQQAKSCQDDNASYKELPSLQPSLRLKIMLMQGTEQAQKMLSVTESNWNAGTKKQARTTSVNDCSYQFDMDTTMKHAGRECKCVPISTKIGPDEESTMQQGINTSTVR